MNYLHTDLGYRHRGDVVEVTLSSGANVRLLDSTNFQRYRRGDSHNFYGGLARRTPVRLPIPRSGHWHVVVDMQGLRGSTRAGVVVRPGSSLRPLPPIQDYRGDIASIVDNAAAARPSIDHGEADTGEFDVFVCHASENKDDVVRPLALELRAHGLEVWYDEFELRLGDSLRRKIDHGIAHSRFGIVVVSHAFFAKGWSQYELDGLVTMAVSGKQVLLPIWHEISKDEVIKQSPSLADKVALCTSDYSIEEIATEIAEVVSARTASE